MVRVIVKEIREIFILGQCDGGGVEEKQRSVWNKINEGVPKIIFG